MSDLENMENISADVEVPPNFFTPHPRAREAYCNNAAARLLFDLGSIMLLLPLTDTLIRWKFVEHWLDSGREGAYLANRINSLGAATFDFLWRAIFDEQMRIKIVDSLRESHCSEYATMVLDALVELKEVEIGCYSTLGQLLRHAVHIFMYDAECRAFITSILQQFDPACFFGKLLLRDFELQAFRNEDLTAGIRAEMQAARAKFKTELIDMLGNRVLEQASPVLVEVQVKGSSRVCSESPVASMQLNFPPNSTMAFFVQQLTDAFVSGDGGFYTVTGHPMAAFVDIDCVNWEGAITMLNMARHTASSSSNIPDPSAAGNDAPQIWTTSRVLETLERDVLIRTRALIYHLILGKQAVVYGLDVRLRIIEESSQWVQLDYSELAGGWPED